MSLLQKKLENPDRLAELNPIETLKRLGFGQNDILCDIGAGTGIFTIPAAKITNNTVFALELKDELLKIINEKAEIEKLANIKTIKVTSKSFDIETDTIDVVILVTVFHEIENKENLLNELKRIIKATGKLAIIEFHKRKTHMGPPVAHRVGKDEVEVIISNHGFKKSDEFDLSENFYCIVFKS